MRGAHPASDAGVYFRYGHRRQMLVQAKHRRSKMVAMTMFVLASMSGSYAFAPGTYRPQRSSASKTHAGRYSGLPTDLERRRFVMIGSLLSCLPLALPGRSRAVEGVAEMLYEQMTTGPDAVSIFSFQYPASFELASKLLKTHLEEVTLKSKVVKGLQCGVAVDPVRIQRIDQFGSPTEVAKRVVALERKKEGVTNVELLEARAVQEGSLPYYVFDYVVDSSRGKNRYIAKSAVKDQRLYVFTVQVKKSDYTSNEEAIQGMISSFRVQT